MDRRVAAAIALMMLIAILPALLKRPAPSPVPVDTAVGVGPAPLEPPIPSLPEAPPARPPDTAATKPERLVPVASPLYHFSVSTRGARLSEAVLRQYRSLAPAERGQPAQLLPPQSDLLGLRLVGGGDTLAFSDWDFVADADSVVVAGDQRLTLTTRRGGVDLRLVYRFRPDQYTVAVEGQVGGLGPNGGTLLIGMGPGLRNIESDSVEHLRELAVVTKARETKKTGFASLEPGQPTELSGPFEWVAIKSKYFVAAIFAVDTTPSGSSGRITGVRAAAIDQGRQVAAADVQASLAVPAAGGFGFTLYAGPMEYPQLRAMGHDFYDVNPYGWPGFRTIIRPAAVAGRWLLVAMHDRLGIAYGFGLVLFGILVRLALWPLNQKAMRASMQMQVIQPLLKDVQERYKNDPQRQQQEMFKLYKEYKVNPFGGCWPMLVPMPVLFALFFVFQNTIELRGAPFLWLDDLSRADPIYIIPVLMGLSMFLVSKIGQMGMAPNPQMKMMLYVMPVMMTVLFLNFASGLNLYYAVQNVASIPQQWMLSRERSKHSPPAPLPAPKPPPSRPKK
jgi:YidC/Oxa1 family membrane protein insertase